MRKLWWLVPAAGIAAAVYWYHGWQHWLSYSTGSYDCPPAGCPGATPHHYNYNSGFGSIIESVGLTWLGIGAAVWWHHQCSQHGCYWYARKTTAAGDRACFLHHPERHLKLSQHDILHRHKTAEAASDIERH